MKAHFLVGFLISCIIGVHSQDKNLADSLIIAYEAGNYNPKEELDILNSIAFNHPDPDQALVYGELLVAKAKAADSASAELSGYLQLGNAYRLKGDLTKSLNNYFKAENISGTIGDEKLGLIYQSIAAVYSIMGNRKSTITYYKNALEILSTADNSTDSLYYAAAVENLGDEYNLNLNQPDSALVMFAESGAIFRALNYEAGIAYNLGNTGLAYAKKGENTKAQDYMLQASSILSKLGDFYPICVYLTYMADIYMERGDVNRALDYANRSLQLAKEYKLKDQINDAYLKLSQLHETVGNNDEAFKYYKAHITYKDSVNNIESVQQMANFEVAQKELQVEVLNQQRKTQKIVTIATSAGLFLIGLLAVGLYRRNKYIQKTKKIIESEKKLSESLLLNILPEETAEELKLNGKVRAKRFESVTVLFTDFEGFTQYSENLPPEDLVESVDFYFSRFDDIIEKYGMEKIKTIGDSYMAAGGLHFDVKDHAVQMIHAAREILEFVNNALANNPEQKARFSMRIGINTGPVVAGVVGTSKFSYDIWGDTVNVASRMESTSQPGRINVSETTFELIKDYFECEFRGHIQVKNRGKLNMYFVGSPKVKSNVKTISEPQAEAKK